MTNEELDHLARAEQAMIQARWAISLQLGRWRDGDDVCAVMELQNAYDALADLVGDAKMQERANGLNVRNRRYRLAWHGPSFNRLGFLCVPWWQTKDC